MPKTKVQFEQLKEKRKDEIIDAALRCFCKIGFEATKIDNITQEAKCSHGLFYHYYQTKEEVFDDVLKKVNTSKFNRIIAELEAPAKSAYDKIKNFTIYLLDSIKNGELPYDIHFLMDIYMIRQDEKSFKIALEKVESIKRHFITLIEQGQRDEGFKEGKPRDIAMTYLSTIQGFILQKINRDQLLNDSRPFILPSYQILLSLFK